MTPRVTEWLLTYFIHSSALILLVFGFARFTRGESTLERLWRIALVGPVLSTTVWSLIPSWFVTILSPDNGVGRLAAGGRQLLLAPELGSWSSSLGVKISVLLWAAGALAGLASLLLGHLKLARLLRGKTPVSHHSEARVFAAPGLHTPVALPSGEICLPAAAFRRLSAEELDAVLVHEQEHIRRRDPLWLILNSVICRLFFFQPLNWMAARRLQGLAEFLCDASAARRTSPVAVASALATVADWIGEERLLASGMATAESLTVARVKRILRGDTGGDRGWNLVPVAGAFLLGLSIMGPGIAFERSGPTVPYTIAAYDDGGRFTVTIDRGRVTGMTMNNVPVSASAIEQRGNRVEVALDGHAPLSLTLTENGGMRWSSRPPAVSLD
jgi:beta-lactamase regulating signal transducer with metallopeptidase domain